MIPAKANSISLVLVLTHGTTQLASKIVLSKLHRALSDCSFLVFVVGRIMAPQRCPPPQSVNMLPYMAKETANVIKIRILKWGEYPGLSGWAQCNHRVLLSERERLGRESEGK